MGKWGGCCMMWKLVSAEGPRDEEIEDMDVGETHWTCSRSYDVKFANTMGPGPYNLYDLNKWYYNNVPKIDMSSLKTSQLIPEILLLRRGLTNTVNCLGIGKV